MEPDWLKWAKELQAIAQIGLAYPSGNHFDRQRYERIREIAAELMSAHGGASKLSLLKMFEREVGYATPKVDVRGVVFHEGKILLVREVADGGWTLPGGWADVNESPRESVVREVREESGYEIRPVKLLAVYDRSKHDHKPLLPFHVYKLFILCERIGGKAKTSFETSEIGFFGLDELPELSASRVTLEQIRHLFGHFHHSAWPTDFD